MLNRNVVHKGGNSNVPQENAKIHRLFDVALYVNHNYFNRREHVVLIRKQKAMKCAAC
ncbi:hypothetical protein B4168_1146 [Anoxybacillus flavithermus]|nr:hypothetical protein B4168_1146 [Anoxybacillus flavithermus]OAO88211.1 hypothetical protein GT23_0487 [Parageobacillus thermoglucosidasius]